MKPKSATRGIYFLANDHVTELVIAFLNSLRKYNPDIPLCLIPFDQYHRGLLKLKDKFDFSVYPHQDVLGQCDEISHWFHPRTVGHYRKLACWHGPFDEFIYIDVDTLVLRNLDFIFPLLRSFDILTSKSNIRKDECWVWKQGIRESGLLNDEQISFAANTGFIASSSGALTIDNAMKAGEIADKLRPYLELFCQEQPFLNYLIVTSGRKYSSLYALLDTSALNENIVEYWTGYRNCTEKDGVQFVVEKGREREAFLFHWAGEWQGRKIDHTAFLILRKLRLRKDPWPVRLFMPSRKLWKHYRQLDPDLRN